MKRMILLILLAALLVGVIGFGIWYMDEEGKMRTGNKNSFIPYNSALVLSINARPNLAPNTKEFLEKDFISFRENLLYQIADTLQKQEYVTQYPYVLAVRIEGKNDLSYLYVMDNKDVLSRTEIARFLNQVFAKGVENVREYDDYNIYTLTRNEEIVYFTVCGGIVLISDSELYIEDGLKQFDLEAEGKELKPRYQNLNKYFSAGSGINVFLNESVFTEVMPLFVQVKKVFPHLDMTKLFKWGSLDGEMNGEGVCFNGFMHYKGLEESYIQTLEKQEPKESKIDGVVPSQLIALNLLNLSNPEAYFTSLDAFRHSVGRKKSVSARKLQYDKMFGRTNEEQLRTLLQGEFAMVTLSYNKAIEEKDGLVIAALKSGGLGVNLLEKMLNSYARFEGKELKDYSRQYGVDSEKKFTYYCCPVDDLASIYWGDIFTGMKSRYVLILDNYLVLASSEAVIKDFIRNYVHGSFIRDSEWYRHLKTKMAGKYNYSYFAKSAENYPLYMDISNGALQKMMKERANESPIFPSIAFQWSNEGELLYNTLFLSAAKVEDENPAHVLWQTKLGGRVSMKPVPVKNHITGKRELFVQDDNNLIYLINDIGRILWKIPVDGPINSEVYQVDLFKNGKLQYLFSTATKIYLIDRNGDNAGRFPLTLKARCEQGITLYDYDNNKEYRIFAPCEDRNVYLYDIGGDLIKGWEPAKTDKPIVTRVQYFRVKGKDYVVLADQYRLYILDRRGKERVRVASVLDLPEKVDLFLVRNKGEEYLLITGNKGTIYQIGFNGKLESFQVKGLNSGYRMNVADVNKDRIVECIFTDGNRLLVSKLDGDLVLEKKVELDSLGYPYVYRFSDIDTRIGLVDPKQQQMLLLTQDGNLSKGFPIVGDSPFSIIFSGEGIFYLFAGVENGSLIKYKVHNVVEN